jgi:hypothetical protein
LLPEDETTSNTTNTTHTNERRGAESAFPLSTDVVRLVGHGGGDVAVCASRGEEDAKVAHGGVLVEAHERQADEAQQHVEQNDGAAHVVLVTEVAGGVHDDAGEGVGRRDEALRCADGEAHIGLEDDGQEVGEGVGDGCCVEEDL